MHLRLVVLYYLGITHYHYQTYQISELAPINVGNWNSEIFDRNFHSMVPYRNFHSHHLTLTLTGLGLSGGNENSYSYSNPEPW